MHKTYKTHKPLTRVVTGALTALGLACSLPAQAAEPVTLKVAPHASLRLLDPLTTTAYITRNHGYMVYDTLFSVDVDSNPKPQMVETWETSDDGLRWTFRLREGLKFHDGAPVTSEDVIASLERWMKRDLTGGRLAAVLEEMRPVDERQFEVVLNKPFGPMLDALGKPSSLVPFIMPKRIVEAAGDQNISEYIGSGPYRFVADAFQPGVKVVYEKFEDYRPRNEDVSGLAGGKKVLVDKIEWLSFPDVQTTTNALRAGEIDMIERLNFDNASQLQGVPDVTLHKMPNLSVPVMRINWLQPPFDNVKIRQAVLHAISQRDFMDALIGDEEGYATCGSMFGCNTPLSNDAGVVVTDEAKLDEARALLKEGGYKNEKVVILNNTDTPSFQGLAPLTAQMLRSIGMDVEVQSMDFATYLSRRNLQVPVSEGGWSIAFGVWEAIDLASPLSNMNLDSRGAKGYAGWSEDADIERLKSEFAAARDASEQKRIAAEIQRIGYEKVFNIPLGGWYNHIAQRANITPQPNSLFTIFWGIGKQ